MGVEAVLEATCSGDPTEEVNGYFGIELEGKEGGDMGWGYGGH